MNRDRDQKSGVNSSAIGSTKMANAMSVIGGITSVNKKDEDFEIWCKIFEQFCAANEVPTERQRASILTFSRNGSVPISNGELMCIPKKSPIRYGTKLS